MKADEALSKVISKKPGAGRPRKVKQSIPEEPKPTTGDPISDFATILDQCSVSFDISRLPETAQSQKAKMFYEAALLKLKHDAELGKYLLADEVRKDAAEAARMTKDQVLALADRCAPLVAANSDQFECKQILLTEINYILQGIADGLRVQE